jgi:hypothetical protein
MFLVILLVKILIWLKEMKLIVRFGDVYNDNEELFILFLWEFEIDIAAYT